MSAATDVDVVVVGAGVVGLAIARALGLRGREAWVLEAEARAGEGVSSRNSGVIHAGFYYTPGSAKAAVSAAGNPDLKGSISATHFALSCAILAGVAADRSSMNSSAAVEVDAAPIVAKTSAFA